MRYSLGLDIGITSVGWAVLDMEQKRIEDLGVRLFPGAENPKDGSSLAAPRREARSSRRRLRRKRQRLSDIRRLIISSGLLSEAALTNLFQTPNEYTPWQLRAEGLDRKLSPFEWARVLIHIAKHRGFKSNRTVSPEEKNAKANEEGKAKEGMKSNSLLLSSGNDGKGYRTVGEMIEKDPKFQFHKRNKSGDYSNTIVRSDLESEIKTLFSSQREYGNKFTSAVFEEEYIKLFNRQLPFASGEIIEKMTGNCTFEPDQKRAPKASWTAERFILLGKILNIRVRVDGKKMELGPEKMRIIHDLAYKNAKVTYKQIRKALDEGENWHFENLPPVRSSSDKKSDPEDAVFVELKAFHSFRKCISDKLGKEYWENIISTSPTILDTLAYALTFRKTDEEIISYLKNHNIDCELINAVLPLNFNGVVNLSIKAMANLIPHMENGNRYDEACQLAGYSHYDPHGGSDRSLLLPIPNFEEIRNPVVFRAITQTRKVVNAIIRKHGSPERVQIELARDLSRSIDDRRKIEKEQLDNKAQKEKLSLEFEKLYSYKPNGAQLEKYRLWKEQEGFCPYTGEYIHPDRAFMSEDGNYAEIDHIIPYSRSFDDSFTNKVLVMGSANRNKKDRTPYEYFGSDIEKWRMFVANVDAHVKNRRRAERLKMKDIDESDEETMKERSLGDTRYITKYVAGWIENNIIFSDPSVKRPVTRINGRATATLRWQWGINALKDRQKSDLHHALDACVIAAATPSIIKSISDYSRKKELSLLRSEEQDKKKTRLPEPWPYFRKEVEARLSDDPVSMINEFGLKNYPEDKLATVKPIFVSRKPERKVSGAAHEETIRSAKHIEDLQKTAVRTSILSVNLSRLENMVGKERDTALYEALKNRLKEFANDPKKAFKDGFRKPTKNGEPGPIVRTIKLYDSGTSGVEVCGGIAANGSMVRLDVFTKNSKYYLIPYYVDDIAKRRVKNKAIVANKNENLWETVDSTFDFLFSIYKNDLIYVIDSKGKELFGYYSGCNRSTGAIDILHNTGECLWQSVGIRTVKKFEKFDVDVLGNYYKVKKETPPYELA